MSPQRKQGALPIDDAFILPWTDAMTDLVKTWEAAEHLLRDANTSLSSNLRNEHAAKAISPDPDNMFETFIEQNELELAWDELADVGERENAGTDFWTRLAEAARLMQLTVKEEYALDRAARTSHSTIR